MTADVVPFKVEMERVETDADTLAKLAKSFSLPTIEKEEKIKPPVNLDGRGPVVSLLSEPKRRQVVYPVLDEEEFVKRYPDAEIFFFGKVENMKHKMADLRERPEGFFHGCRVSAGRKTKILAGPPLECVDPAALEAAEKARQKRAATAMRTPVSNPGERPQVYHEHAGITEADAIDILKELKACLCIGINEAGYDLIEAFGQAVEQHLELAEEAEDAKKFRWRFAIPCSLQVREDGSFLVEADPKIKVTKPWFSSCRIAGAQRAAEEAKRKAMQAAFFDGTTGEYTEPESAAQE